MHAAAELCRSGSLDGPRYEPMPNFEARLPLAFLFARVGVWVIIPSSKDAAEWVFGCFARPH
eukprot:2855887-Alexandrium_andersonii.AAC.1